MVPTALGTAMDMDVPHTCDGRKSSASHTNEGRRENQQAQLSTYFFRALAWSKPHRHQQAVIGAQLYKIN